MIEAAEECNVDALKLDVFEEKKARQMICQGALWITDSRIDEVEKNEVTAASLQTKYWTAFEIAVREEYKRMTVKQREEVEDRGTR